VPSCITDPHLTHIYGGFWLSNRCRWSGFCTLG